jgi:hypothetical protein
VSASFRIELQSPHRIDLVSPALLGGVAASDVEDGVSRRQLVYVHAIRTPLLPEALFVDPSLVTGDDPQLVGQLVPRQDPVTANW